MQSFCWSLNVTEMFLLLFACVLMFLVAVRNTFFSLKLDLTLTHTLFFLSVLLSKSEEGALRSLKEPLWRAKWWVFFTVWGESRLLSSLCLTSQYFGVSLIEAMLSFTSFLYFISLFPVHVEVHSWPVREAFSHWRAHNNFSHFESAA